MKNEFDILNEIKNNINHIEEVNLSDEDKKNISNRVIKKIKKNNNSGIKIKRIIASTLVIGITGSFLLTNEEVLAQINGIGRKIESFFHKEDDSLEKYKKDIVQESEDKGIKFMLHEVMLDDEELYISASIDYKNFEKSTLNKEYNGDLTIIPSQMEPKFEIELNGNPIDVTGAGGSYEYNEDETVDMLLRLDMQNNNLNEIYDIKMNIVTMEAQSNNAESEYIEGNWELAFKVDGNEIAKDMKIININEEIELDYKDMKIALAIDELRISPASMSLKYRANGVELMENNLNVEFKFTDENNEKIEFISQGGSNEGMSYKYMIDRDIEKIKVVPVIVKHTMLSQSEKKFEDKAIEIDLKN